jgi:hypothetical protein
MSARSWIPYATLLVVFWGVWGAFSSLPTTEYGYPDEMIYIIWSVTMLIPAFFILWGERTFDRRPIGVAVGRFAKRPYNAKRPYTCCLCEGWRDAVDSYGPHAGLGWP